MIRVLGTISDWLRRRGILHPDVETSYYSARIQGFVFGAVLLGLLAIALFLFVRFFVRF